MIQLESDKQFGLDIMKAAGIHRCHDEQMDGMQITVLSWFTRGNQVGPIFAYFGNEKHIKLMWPYTIKEPRIYQSTLRKALPIIKRTGFSGCVGLRLLIKNGIDKPYGIRWHTSITNELMQTMSKLMKSSFAEWMRFIEDGSTGDWLLHEFDYTYVGSAIDGINDANMSLLSLRTMGYEIPVAVVNQAS